MKSHNKIHWKQEENDLLIKLYSQKSLTTDKIAAIYFKGKSGDAIRKRAKRLGIKRYTGKNHKKSYLKYRFEILEKNISYWKYIIQKKRYNKPYHSFRFDIPLVVS